jgi:hypothetical protein
MVKKVCQRSNKSREKWADSLMDTGTKIHITTFITIFIWPLTAMVTLFGSQGAPSGFDVKFNRVLFWVQGWTVFLYPIAIYFGIWLKNKAMNIYDDLSENEATH